MRLVLCSALLGVGTVAIAQDSRPLAANNSGLERQRSRPGVMSAGQQSSAKSDVELTREIRRAVVKDDQLSMIAHNVKIVSSSGTVTLRGPVKTREEKVVIGHKARALAGKGMVDNQLEVIGQK